MLLVDVNGKRLLVSIEWEHMPRRTIRRKILVGLDLDGVILDHTSHKIMLAEQFGFSIKPNDTPSDIMKNKIEENSYEALQRILYEDAKLARHVPLVFGAKAGLHYLKSIGLPYVLISRRRLPDTAFLSLKCHNLWPEYFDSTNSFFVAEKKDKNSKANAVGVTHFVDDEPSVIAELTSVPQKFLFDPLRVYLEAPTGSEHVYSWEEFLGKVSNF